MPQWGAWCQAKTGAEGAIGSLKPANRLERAANGPSTDWAVSGRV
jgi:hypothetical protein